MGTAQIPATANAIAYSTEDQQRMSLARNYFAWQGRLVRQALGRRVIEVGCGVGNFTEMLLDRDVVIAVDKEPSFVERLKLRYPNRRNLHALVRDAASAGFADLAQFRADTCVCLNVIEHIHDDREALSQMASVLAPGGAIVLLAPAFPVLYGAIDANLGHFRRYDPASLRQLATAAGLRVRRLRYMNAAGFFGWWTNSRIFRREAQSARQIELFDRYFVPLMSRLESAVPPPFGQSLFAVLQRP